MCSNPQRGFISSAHLPFHGLTVGLGWVSSCRDGDGHSELTCFKTTLQKIFGWCHGGFDAQLREFWSSPSWQELVQLSFGYLHDVTSKKLSFKTALQKTYGWRHEGFVQFDLIILSCSNGKPRFWNHTSFLSKVVNMGTGKRPKNFNPKHQRWIKVSRLTN